MSDHQRPSKEDDNFCMDKLKHWFQNFAAHSTHLGNFKKKKSLAPTPPPRHSNWFEVQPEYQQFLNLPK